MTVPNGKRDPEIHQDVRAELAMHQQDGIGTIEITVHRGVVSLTGLVESYAQKRAIDRAVRRIIGVRDLQDYLHVQVEAALRRLLGVVTLRGVVPRFTMLAEIERAVSSIPGITRIDNQLQPGLTGLLWHHAAFRYSLKVIRVDLHAPNSVTMRQ